MLNICVNLHENISKGFQVKEMTEITIYNVQRAVTPKVDKQELWFLCSAHCPMIGYICVKLHEYILN